MTKLRMLRWWHYFKLNRWAQCNLWDPYKREAGGSDTQREREGNRPREKCCYVIGSGDGGSGQKTRNGLPRLAGGEK